MAIKGVVLMYALDVIEAKTMDNVCVYLAVSKTAFIVLDLEGELISSTPISPSKQIEEIH